MNHHAHKIGGVCAGVIACTTMMNAPITYDKCLLSGTLLIGSFIGGLLLDIDHPDSKMGRKFRFLSWGINKVFGHRGLTHTLIFTMLLSILLFFCTTFFDGYLQVLYSQFVIGITVGCLSHLLLDSMTKAGVPLFYPFTKKHFRIAKFRTNRDEFVVSTICIVVTLAIVAILI
ncbi:metal-dependent hydrolase [Bacillus cereus group sp. MG11]|uniref:metal-dependent hydrolase n=1 Tax=Bacillus cereus group sp. MG11 TaxID=3040248 RepID=UPI0033938948